MRPVGFRPIEIAGRISPRRKLVLSRIRTMELRSMDRRNYRYAGLGIGRAGSPNVNMVEIVAFWGRAWAGWVGVGSPRNLRIHTAALKADTRRPNGPIWPIERHGAGPRVLRAFRRKSIYPGPCACSDTRAARYPLYHSGNYADSYGESIRRKSTTLANCDEWAPTALPDRFYLS